MDRKEIYSIIKEKGISKDIYAYYGKPYSSVSTSELKDFIGCEEKADKKAENKIEEKDVKDEPYFDYKYFRLIKRILKNKETLDKLMHVIIDEVKSPHNSAFAEKAGQDYKKTFQMLKNNMSKVETYKYRKFDILENIYPDNISEVPSNEILLFNRTIIKLRSIQRKIDDTYGCDNCFSINPMAFGCRLYIGDIKINYINVDIIDDTIYNKYFIKIRLIPSTNGYKSLMEMIESGKLDELISNNYLDKEEAAYVPQHVGLGVKFRDVHDMYTIYDSFYMNYDGHFTTSPHLSNFFWLTKLLNVK